MEEEKKQEEEKEEVVFQYKTWQEIIGSDISDIEVLNSARPGTIDYDFDSVSIIKEGGQGIVFEIKSNVDGEIYAAKRLQYQTGSKLNSRMN